MSTASFAADWPPPSSADLPMVGALTKIKSYLDHGIFQPIQIAAAHALRSQQECAAGLRDTCQRRAEARVGALARTGWPVAPSLATLFVWAPISGPFVEMGCVEFARLILRGTGVVVSPGLGLGPEGEGHVRFAVMAGEERLREAGERVGRALQRKP